MKATFISWLAALLLIFMTAMAASCSKQRLDRGHNCQLVASIEPLRAIVAEIAGEDWQVSAIVPQGFSPEDYSPSAAQMAEIADTRCIFKVGRLGFETVYLPQVQKAMPDLNIVDTSEGIGEATFDPHTWMLPDNIKIIAANVCRVLSQVDSVNATVYAERLRALEVRTDSLDSEIRHLLADVRSRTFIITHPALTHFAAHYGLRQLAIEPDGKEPTPNSVRALITQAKADSAQVIFVQQEFSDRSARMIAEQTGVRVVSINPLADDWYGELLRIAQALNDGR